MDPKETTLQINKFKGIDRSDDGINDAPDQFEILQNWHVKSPGELEGISGVVDLNTVALPGVAKIIKTVIIKDAVGDDKELLFYRPGSLGNWTPTETSANFTKTGISVNSGKFMVSYIGPGGLVRSKFIDCTANFTTAEIITFTPSGSVPTFVGQIDIYEEARSPLGVANPNFYRWMGSLQRKIDGTFASSIVLGQSNLDYDAATTASITTPPSIGSSVPSLIRTRPTTTNRKSLYFGVSPYFFHENNKPRVSLVDNQTPFQFLKADIDWANGLLTDAVIKFAYNSTGASAGRNIIGDLGIKKVNIFAGITPEDATLASVDPADATGKGIGRIVPIQLEEVRYIGATVNTTDDSCTLTYSGIYVAGDLKNLNDGDQIMIQLSGGTIPGLTDNTRYYVRINDDLGAGSVSVYFYTTLNNYLNDIRVDLTGARTGSPRIHMLTARFRIGKDNLINSRNHVHMVTTQSTGTAPSRAYSYDRSLVAPSSWQAISARSDGLFHNQWICFISGLSSGLDSNDFVMGNSLIDTSVREFSELDVIGCWVLNSSPFALNTSYQLFPQCNHRSLSQSSQRFLEDTVEGQKGYGLFWNPTSRNQDFEGDSEVISTTPFGQRIIIGNGDNILWYTNGYMITPIMRTNGKAQIPQSKYVQAFSNRIVAAGGFEAVQNSPNQAYYSEIQTPFDWGTTINSLNCFSLQPINGLGAYSQNLLDQGFSAFCVISKRDGLFIWDGDSTNGAKQIYYSFGFAGPRSFVATDFGPVFLSRSNAFFIQGTEIKDVGNEIKTIVRGLNDVQLHRIHATYHNKILKFAYPSATTGDPDSDQELWMELRTEAGGLQKYWSGPHVMKGSYDQAAAIGFGTERDIRISCSGAKLYQRDIGNSNNGADIERKIQLSRLGLQADHFLKTLRAFYLAVKIETDEQFTITLDAEDGSDQMILNADSFLSNGARHILQYSNPDRFLGRVNTITIDQTSSTPISIYDISIIFKQLRRRLLRY